MKTVAPIFLALSGIASAHPSDWTVQPGESIQAAINNASDGDRILVEPGNFSGAINFLGKQVEVIGVNGSGVTTLDASALTNIPAIIATRGETFGTVLRGFTVVASTWDQGGLARITGSQLTMEDIVLDGVDSTGRNIRLYAGGSVRFQGSASGQQGNTLFEFWAPNCSIDIRDSNFSFCAAVVRSGTAGAEAGLSIAVTNSSFSDLIAPCMVTDGGDTIAITDCEIRNCHSGFFPYGASEFRATRCRWINCTGTGIFITDSPSDQTCTLSDCQFINHLGRCMEIRDVENIHFDELDLYSCGGDESIFLRNCGQLSWDGGVVADCETGSFCGPMRFDVLNALEVHSVRFDGNSHVAGGFNPRGGGAGWISMADGEAQASFVDCQFRSNSALSAVDGGALHLNRGAFSFSGCTFDNNFCVGDGGAIYVPNSELASLAVSNCRFFGNSAGLTVQAIYCRRPAMIEDSFFLFNGTGQVNDWGACYFDNPSPVRRCTFVGNDGRVGRRGQFLDCIFWDHDGNPAESTFQFCNYEGGIGGTGNINDDPLFRDPVFLDYRTLANSPCRGAGSSGGDIGADHLVGFDDCNGNDIIDVAELATGDCDLNGVLDACELSGRDCNQNGLLDDCEIASGSVSDCNLNGIPDACEVDCNGNGIPDECDITSGFSLDLDGDGIPDDCKPDCDGDGIPDFIEIYYGTQLDCNGNNVPDDCDLLTGTSLDCNGNGIPDECDILSGIAEDCNSNGIPDSCDLLTMDCNGNGIVDACDIASGFSQDLNQDGFPDECKPDCNGNGLPDYLDIQFGASSDCDGNGVPDECETDCNGNGIVDGCDIQDGTESDCNGNGLPDSCEVAAGTDTDCDGDGVLDSCQLAAGTGADCNQNGTLDACDIASGLSTDCDGNGIPDECETDCNGNGVADACDISAGTSLDCNGNGIPDECEIADGSETDCNGNSVLDSCEIASGDSQDCNGNGIPDECESDCNGNGFDDSCDLSNGTSQDCNGNLQPDECDIASGLELDCNGNGIPDSCDLLAMTSLDCNGNGIPDECDIASGVSADCDGDGVPDECQIGGNPNLDLNANGILDSCECQAGNYCTTSPNSAGSGALISYSGTAFVSFNDLTLISTGLPPNEFGLFFYGASQVNTTNGDGVLCVGGIYRLTPTLANASGTAALSLDLTQPPQPAGQIDAGETWNFQLWYRDPSAGGSGYNFSDALSITFCP